YKYPEGFGLPLLEASQQVLVGALGERVLHSHFVPSSLRTHQPGGSASDRSNFYVSGKYVDCQAAVALFRLFILWSSQHDHGAFCLAFLASGVGTHDTRGASLSQESNS